MKACRKMLEEDLGLPEKSLALHKEVIQRFVDKVSTDQDSSCAFCITEDVVGPLMLKL